MTSPSGERTVLRVHNTQDKTNRIVQNIIYHIHFTAKRQILKAKKLVSYAKTQLFNTFLTFVGYT